MKLKSFLQEHGYIFPCAEGKHRCENAVAIIEKGQLKVREWFLMISHGFPNKTVDLSTFKS